MKKVITKHIKGNRFEIFPGGNKNIFYSDKPEDESSALDPDPIDLFLASLGSCVGLFSKMYCAGHSKKFTELRVDTSAELSSDTPQRLVNISLKVRIDADLKGEEEKFLRHIRSCIIHNTIRETEEVSIELA